ncbi:hypothetical protein GCM10008955_36150 [Deinococcus malanensis]|uniref:Uncharacterized protein n=2 Tax=Deinococcus malanensis TaxID=1706855 RepID=A0ABQ2F0T6_9DEIO|nr:hypothetical protein GCM10008955_36150 [Deinococcus malanensis]
MGITKENLRKDWLRPFEILIDQSIPRDATGQYEFSPVVYRVFKRAIKDIAPQLEGRELRNARALRAALAEDPDVGPLFEGSVGMVPQAVPGDALAEIAAEVRALRLQQESAHQQTVYLTRAVESQATDHQKMVTQLLPALATRETFHAESVTHLMVTSRAAEIIATGVIELSADRVQQHQRLDDLERRYDQADRLQAALQVLALEFDANRVGVLHADIRSLRMDVKSLQAEMMVPAGLSLRARWWGFSRDVRRHGGTLLVCAAVMLTALWWFTMPGRLMYTHALQTSARPWTLLPAVCHVQVLKPATARLPLCRY